MRLEVAKLLEDIRVAASDALDMSAGKTFEQFTSDKQLRYAIERCFEPTYTYTASVERTS